MQIKQCNEGSCLVQQYKVVTFTLNRGQSFVFRIKEREHIISI
jgi:hypothetical protein